MSEMVSHPSHYNKAGRKECIVEMEEKYGAEATAIIILHKVGLIHTTV